VNRSRIWPVSNLRITNPDKTNLAHLQHLFNFHTSDLSLERGAKGQRVTDWNDYPPEKAAFFQRTPDWYRQRAGLIGTSTKEMVEALL